MSDFKGIGVALVTPFDNGEVDYEGLGKVMQHTESHVDYYVAMGTTGESATVTQSEKRSVLSYILKNRKGKPVVYGIGGNNTSAVLREIEQTSFEGVEAILSVSPYYNKPSQAGIIRHYELIADASPVPVILYNVPGRTGSNILADSTIVLSQHKNIIGIKEASGNMDQCFAIRTNAEDNFLLISGDDLMTPELIDIGAVGVISVLANGIPEVFREFVVPDKQLDKAKLTALSELNSLMYEEGNPVGIKEVLKQRGICENEVRLPLLKASEALSARIIATLSELT